MYVYKAFGMAGKDVISEDDAFDYAMEKVKANANGEKKDLIEWFYSGSYIKEELTEEEYIQKYL